MRERLGDLFFDLGWFLQERKDAWWYRVFFRIVLPITVSVGTVLFILWLRVK